MRNFCGLLFKFCRSEAVYIVDLNTILVFILMLSDVPSTPFFFLNSWHVFYYVFYVGVSAWLKALHCKALLILNYRHAHLHAIKNKNLDKTIVIKDDEGETTRWFVWAFCTCLQCWRYGSWSCSTGCSFFRDRISHTGQPGLSLLRVLLAGVGVCSSLASDWSIFHGLWNAD